MTTRHSSNPNRSIVGATTVAASAGMGVFAAAVAYFLTYLLAVDQARVAFGETVPEWKTVAWFFYNAHLVDLEIAGAFAGFGGTTTVDLIAEANTTSTAVLYVVPPLVLLGAGALLAYHLDARAIGEGVLVGAPVTIGYAVVLGIGAIVTRSDSETTILGVEASGSIGPALVSAVGLAGVLYPLLFATAGAVLVTLFRSR